jgi:hypothetical protein
MFFAALLATILGLGSSGVGLAQSPATSGDPAGRVGRLAKIDGTVSFHTTDESQWEAATLNYPITSGNSLWTEPQAHAAVDIGGSRLYLDNATELDIGTLDDQGFQAQLPRGAVYLRTGGQDGSFEIDTPRGAVTITQPGHYEIVAGDAQNPTTVTPLDGSAEIAGPGVNMTVAAGQTASLTGQNPVAGTAGPAQQDSFIAYADDADRPYYNPAPVQPQVAQQAQPSVTAGYAQPSPQYVAPSVQYVSPAMTGYEDLNQYGQWQQSPSYGPVWIPQVHVGWAPYRYGHWCYIHPWGWTWIDDAPWGFTPFHYGRWVWIGPQWAWVPGVIVARPVYAPALVSFFGHGSNITIGGGPAVGWVPLGPGEVWYPPYRYSPGYLRNANITNVNVTRIVNINNTTIINNRPVGSFMNSRGVTVVTASAMTNSQPIGRAFRSIPPAELQGSFANLTARSNQVPVQPTLRTAGLNPTTARMFGNNLPANGALPGRPVAPGPQVSASNRGTSFGNGHSLPTFYNAQSKTGPQNGRVITLGNGGQQTAPATFGNLSQQTQQGVKQAKPAAPGPAILPHNNTGTNRYTLQGNGGQNWSSLPALQKQGQQNGLHTNGTQQNQAHGQVMIFPGTTGGAQSRASVSQGSQRQGDAQLQQKQIFNGGQGQFQGQQGNHNVTTFSTRPQQQQRQGNAQLQQKQIFNGGQGQFTGQQGNHSTTTFSTMPQQQRQVLQQQNNQSGSFGGFTFQQQQQPRSNNTQQFPPPPKGNKFSNN